MSGPALLLLGPPRIERDGGPVEIDTRKALALAAYLAVTRQRASRDALAALLWPESDEGRAALRRTLSVLNKALGEGCLNVDRDHVGLDWQGDLWVDVDDFRRQLAECRRHGHPVDAPCADCLLPLKAAVALYRDDFLVGFTLRDSPEFDDWQFFQAEGLRRELGGALERLTRLFAGQSRFEEAIAYARRWLSLDDLHEPAHRALMELYAWAGQRAAALRQYETCVRVLARELDVPPLEATSRLYQAIKENRTPPPPGPSRVSTRPLRSRTTRPIPSTAVVTSRRDDPLVGRVAEWGALRAAYDATVNGGRVVVLEGEAGIGKTRLAEAFLADVVTEGALVLTARSYEGETGPAYGAFIELLRAATVPMDRDGVLATVPPWALREAARLLPELGGRHVVPSAPLDTLGAQARFFEGICHVFLAGFRDGSPVVLFIDDAQWTDAASLNLLAYLTRRVHDQPLLLLITWRGEDGLADHHLHPLLSAAERTGTLTVLRLPRLSRSKVEEFVAQAMARETIPTSTGTPSSRLPENLGQRLYEETEGVPLFLKEYLTVIATGGLDPGDTDWALPDGLRGILRSRLATISDPGRHVLGLAATIGRSFDCDILQAASGRDDETIVAALEELTSRRVIKEVMGSGATETPTYDFHHEKLRTLAYEEISLARRRLLHRRVAEALLGRARACRGGDALAAQIAYHFERGGQERDAATFFAKAGEQARAVYANVEALGYFRAALELGHPDHRALHEAIGDLQTFLGEYGAALASYERARAYDISTDVARLERKRAEVYHRRGDWALAERALLTAMTALGETGPMAERSRLHADQSLVVHHQGRTDEAITLARHALRLAEKANDPRALAQVHNVLGILANRRGDVDAARRHLEQSLAVAEAVGDPDFRVAALNNLALAHGAAGELECALALAETALTLCAARGDRHREAALHNNLADLLHAAGQSTEAFSHVKQAVTIYAEIGVEAGSLRPEIWKLAAW